MNTPTIKTDGATKADGALKEIDWLHQDVDIERAGKKITLPDDPGPMPIDDAIKALERKKKDEEQVFNQAEIIEGYPLDGAVAFVKAMQRSYGWASPVPTPGFSGPQPPEMKTVKLGPKRTDVVQVPWGSFIVPGIENRIMIDSTIHEGRPALVVVGKVRKREQHVILQLVTLAREILREESIYRGKSVSLKVDYEGNLTLEEPPEFMDVASIKEADLILNHETMAAVNMNLFNLLKHTERCRELKVPLKRGVLLSGVYGTGKTMTARTAAAIANTHGWTFINVDKVNGLAAALRFADQYAPAVLFAEDIDRVTTERDDATNDLTVIIDGVLSKTSEVITVLTTNHVEKIEQVMLRPGRLDAVINIDPPNEEAAIRLVNLYARGLIKSGEDLTDAGRVLAGNIPAVIREIVERSKLGMIGRAENVLVAEDLIVAARSMADHLALLNKPRDEPTAAERLAASLVEVINGGTDDVMDEEQLNRSFRSVKQFIERQNGQTQNTVVRAAKEVAGAVGHAQEHVAAAVEKGRASVTATVNNAKTVIVEKIDNI